MCAGHLLPVVEYRQVQWRSHLLSISVRKYHHGQFGAARFADYPELRVVYRLVSSGVRARTEMTHETRRGLRGYHIVVTRVLETVMTLAPGRIFWKRVLY